MKTIFPHLLACLGLVSLVHAQSLTPPTGPIAASMKTFQQVQPRTPLENGQPGVSINAAGTITISQPGSYYLTGNVTLSTLGASGIVITSDNVSVDLNGFTIAKTASTGGAGVFFGTSRSVCIHDGNIQSTTTQSGGSFTTGGFAQGIAGDGADALIRDCGIDGIASGGIVIQRGSVERCIVDTCGGIGIQAMSVQECLATNTGDTAIKLTPGTTTGVVSESSGQCAGTGGSGIDARAGIVRNSRGANRGTSVAVDASAGIFAATVTNALGSSTAGSGIYADQGSSLRGTSTSGPGLYVYVLSDSRGSSMDGRGVWSNQVENSAGLSGTAVGLFAGRTATFCQGARTGGIAIESPVATGCSSAIGTTNVNQKFFGTP